MTTTRPRTSGLNLQRRQSIRPFYEPLSPNVEEKEEDGAHILRLQLLEFEGQQINFKVEEATRTIRVTGERPMGNSRWIRLDKTYSIPEDCIIDKINHQFDQGILTISMPKPTPSQAAADPSPTEDEVRPIESKEPEKDLPKVDSNKSAVLEKQVSDRVKEELERKLTTKREDSSEVKDQKLIQKEEVNNQIAEKEKGDSKTEKEDIKNEISEKDKEESKTAKEEINKQISEKEKEESKTEKEEIKKQISEKEKKESKTEKEEIKKQISEKEKEESKTEKEEIKKQISEKEKKESKTEKKSKEKEKPASKVTRAAKLAGKFAIGRLPWPVKANLAATVVIVAAYFAYTYYRLPTN